MIESPTVSVEATGVGLQAGIHAVAGEASLVGRAVSVSDTAGVSETGGPLVLHLTVLLGGARVAGHARVETLLVDTRLICRALRAVPAPDGWHTLHVRVTCPAGVSAPAFVAADGVRQAGGGQATAGLATVSCTFNERVTIRKMFWAEALGLRSVHISAPGILTTRDSLAGVNLVLRANAAGMVGVAMTTSVATTDETTYSIDTLRIVGTGAGEAFVDLHLTLHLRVAVVAGRTRALRLAVHHITAGISATGSL